MSKKRYIDTLFWDDHYISNLDPLERYVYLYLLTNPCTTICGIYQIPLKRMALDTGIEKEMCQKIIDRFQKDNKVLFKNGWMAIRNFIKHQNATSSKVRIGIQNELKHAPCEMIDFINIDSQYLVPVDPGESLTRRQIILIRDSFECQYCKKEIQTDSDYELDHIVPVAKGGKDNYLNMVLSCRLCNQTKTDKTAMEFCGFIPSGKKYHSEMAIKELKYNTTKRDKFYSIYPESTVLLNESTVLLNESTISNLDSNLNLNLNFDLNKNAFASLRAWFTENNPNYYHDGKQAATMKKLLSKAETLGHDIIDTAGRFKDLIESGEKFWCAQPLTPSRLLSNYDAVISHREAKEKDKVKSFRERDGFIDNLTDDQRESMIAMAQREKQGAIE